MPDWLKRADDFTTGSFPHVKALELAGTLLGVVALAFFNGVADLIATIWSELLISPLRAFAGYLETLVLTPVLGGQAPGREIWANARTGDGWALGFARLFGLAWSNAASWFADAGPAAYGLVITFILLMSYFVAEVTRRG